MTILTDDELKVVRQEEIERFSWKFNELRYARAIEAAVLAKLAQQEPVAMRYDFDGYGYKYIDSGSGSDWRSRIPDAEAVYAAPLPAPQQDERAAFEAELCRLHVLNDELTKAYRKMYNAAAGYSNYCEDSASVRRCDRDFEEADAMFRAALAQKCCKNTT